MAQPRGTRSVLFSPAAPFLKDAEWRIIVYSSQLAIMEQLYNMAPLKNYANGTQLQVNSTRAFKQHARRLWPGGPTVTIPGGSRTVLKGPNMPGRTLPGNPIAIRYRANYADWAADGQNPGSKELTLTFYGEWRRFYQEMSAYAKVSHVVISPHGAAKLMPKAIIPLPA